MKKEKDFVFGMAVLNSEGVNCYGSNTHIENFKSKEMEGEGRVKISIPALNLVNGTYFLNLAVHKRDGFPFDYHHFMYTFKVTSVHRDVGIARVAHSWDFSDNIAFKKGK